MKFKKNIKILKTLIGVGFVTIFLTFDFLVIGTRVVATDQLIQESTANLIAQIIDLNKNFAVQKQRELFRSLEDSSDVLPVVFDATKKINPRFWQDWRCSGQSSNLTEVVDEIDHDRFKEWVGNSTKVFAHGWKELVRDTVCDNLDDFKLHSTLVPISAKAKGGLVEIDGRKHDQLLRFGIALPRVVTDSYRDLKQNTDPPVVVSDDYYRNLMPNIAPVRIIDIIALMGRDNFFRYLTAFEHYPCTPVTFACAIVSGNRELIRTTWDQLDYRDKRQALICGITAFAEVGSLADPDQTGIIQWLLTTLCDQVAQATPNPEAEYRKLKAVLAHTFLAKSFEYHRADSVRLIMGANKTSDQIRLLSEETTDSVEEEVGSLLYYYIGFVAFFTFFKFIF